MDKKFVFVTDGSVRKALNLEPAEVRQLKEDLSKLKDFLYGRLLRKPKENQ